MTRPWRLTRRQRVEMEAALSDLRGYSCGGGGDSMLTEHGIAALTHDDAERIEWETLQILFDTTDQGSRAKRKARAWRVLRARVSIALRAALRADEDARCEEALARIRCDSDVYGACRALGAVREWQDVRRVVRDLPPLRGACEDAACGAAVPRRALVVPLALWERTR